MFFFNVLSESFTAKIEISEKSQESPADKLPRRRLPKPARKGPATKEQRTRPVKLCPFRGGFAKASEMDLPIVANYVEEKQAGQYCSDFC